MTNKLTAGQYKVGLTFNPSGNSKVEEIKLKSAELIDMMLEHLVNCEAGYDEAVLAAQWYENAAMWAVKAVTKQPLFK